MSMVHFLAVPVTDQRAQSLVRQYFADRSASFPASQGGYSVVMPEPVRFTPPNGVFLLLTDTDADIVDESDAFGCGGIRRLATVAGEPVRFEVKHLWVRPQVRGTGAGRALLAELERRAIAFGAAEAVLDTNASLKAADRLYRSSGYREIPPYNDNSNATTWFAKTLDAG